LVSNWALPSITAGQRLADQFFQTLVQGKNSPSDATPTGTVKEALERIMPGQLLRLPGDKVDSLIGEEASSALDWQALADTAWLVAYRAGRTTAAVSEVIADQTALDHYFAEAANDNDGIMDE
jgi:hypothetical protein